MKAVADTLGVARSNLVNQLRHPERRRRGPYRRAGEDEFLAAIRAIIDTRLTYGYRRVTALLNRVGGFRRAAGQSQAGPPPHAPGLADPAVAHRPAADPCP